MPELVWAGILGAGALAAAVPYVLRRKRSEERNRKLDELRSSLGQEAPRQLGDYVVTARLGSGAMATVYRALPAGTLDESQAVAIKVMSRALSLDEAHRTRFQREIIALKERSHEHTVRLLDCGEEEGQFPELPAAVERLVLRLLVKDPLRRFPDARHLGQAMARLETSAPRREGSVVRRPTGEGAEWLSFHQVELEAWRAVPGVAGWTRSFCQDGMAVLEREWVEGSALSAGSQLPPDSVRSLARELQRVLEDVHARGLVHGNLKPSNLIMTTSGLRLTDPRLPGEGPTGDPYQAPELVHGAPQPGADQYGVGAVLQSLLTGEPPGKSDAGVPVEWRGVLRRMLRVEAEDRFPDLASGLKVILESESRPDEGTLQL